MQIRSDEVMLVNNRLTQVGKSFRVKNKTGHERYAVFVCACGSRNVHRLSVVKNGTTKSCSCLKKELIIAFSLKHGHSGVVRTRTYSSWRSMWTRCVNTNLPCWPRYGGRGITVCERWKSFELFLADMGERSPGTSIDRVDNDGNYCPENCKWSTPLEQGRNSYRSNVILIEYDGLKMSSVAWDRRLGFRQETVRKRMYAGWSVERALTQRVRGKLK